VDLFDAGYAAADAPLAARVRPRNLDEVVGQTKVLRKGSPLRRLIEGGGTVSVVLWGPPGTGKTTLAKLMSTAGDRHFVALSALSSGVKELRDAIKAARDQRALHGRRTLLFVDEVHRFSRNQQDALLEAVEEGYVSLVAATTENPSFSVVSALMSRSLLIELSELSDSEVAEVVRRACADPRGLDGRVSVEDDAMVVLVRAANGDARRALTMLEAGAAGVGWAGVVSGDVLEDVLSAPSNRYDASGDMHYDVISAFIKSVRGSDVDAALHYLARMVGSGEDPRFIARRLVVLASEDIGTADASALNVAVNAAHAVALVGMPEAGYALAHATTHLALSMKSNAVTTAWAAACSDVGAGRVGSVPVHLRDGHGPTGPAPGYKYPHDFPESVVTQQYLPDALQGQAYYHPKDSGAEDRIRSRWEWLKERVRRRR
jgi:putative ATPase